MAIHSNISSVEDLTKNMIFFMIFSVKRWMAELLLNFAFAGEF